jgi:tetratricopeptide (TPR) repeat protein
MATNLEHYSTTNITNVNTIVNTKICLNMIVKNESKIITRLLTSVLPIIDSYCICDTGSTDNTVEIIENFFKDHSIEGKIINEPFRDFGYNRTFALKACEGMENADYLLLLDADMKLRINPKLCPKNFRQSLTKDVYYIFQGSEEFLYKNVRILRNSPDFSYWGVTHEFVQILPTTTSEVFNKNIIFIDDIGDGGSKENKFTRDIELLLKGLEENPDNDRYVFYLANSYFNTGNFFNAIKYYEKRIEMGGWKQEVWLSYYSIGKAYKSMGSISNAIYYWMEGYQYYPERIENLYQIVNYYRTESKYVLANAFYELACNELNKNNNKNDYLFLENDIYEYKLDYEFTVFAYYCNKKNSDVERACMKILSHPVSSDNINLNILSNYKFYGKSLKEIENPFPSHYMQVLQNIGKTSDIDRNIYISSTPSIYVDSINKSKMYVNIRYVSYRINELGQYINGEKMLTKNVFSIIDIGSPNWIKISESVLEYNKSYDSLYVGLEDLRLFVNNEIVYFTANRGLDYNKIVVETGIIKSGSASSNLVYMDNQQEIEKNWVMFKNGDRDIKTIYGWYPLKIGSVIDNPEKIIDEKRQIVKKLQITSEEITPNFFRWIRGSTNGVKVNDEVWFICHLVSYEECRYYYHIIVVLDLFTLKLKRFTKLFTFEKEKVEFTLGFVFMEKEKHFLIGYSIRDRETKYMMVSKDNIDSLFISPLF